VASIRFFSPRWKHYHKSLKAFNGGVQDLAELPLKVGRLEGLPTCPDHAISCQASRLQILYPHEIFFQSMAMQRIAGEEGSLSR
jgi:hypothetical protein